MVIVETANSTYEVDTAAKRFRKAAERDWHGFEHMTPARPGRPVRFSWISDESGRSVRIGYYETSPVTAVVDS
jgi:hypothetical protein